MINYSEYTKKIELAIDYALKNGNLGRDAALKKASKVFNIKFKTLDTISGPYKAFNHTKAIRNYD